jgi:hypothetical protein
VLDRQSLALQQRVADLSFVDVDLQALAADGEGELELADELRGLNESLPP